MAGDEKLKIKRRSAAAAGRCEWESAELLHERERQKGSDRVSRAAIE
jgi:hypothetical protein